MLALADSNPPLSPGSLLISAPTESQSDKDPFAQTVVLVVDREPNGIATGLVLNRPLEQLVTDTSALALLFVSDPTQRAFWGGPMGRDPAILAEFLDTDGL